MSLAKNDGAQASESEIMGKVESVFTDNKIHGDSLHLEEFKKICLRDPWLRGALTKLGVLGPADLVVRFFFGIGFWKFFRLEFWGRFAGPRGIWEIRRIIGVFFRDLENSRSHGFNEPKILFLNIVVEAFLEQAFTNFSEPNLGPEIPGPRGTSKTRQTPVKIPRI